ncbi:MAG: mechanosensitive ion channel family protein [Sneathiellaceae bacterium]
MEPDLLQQFFGKVTYLELAQVVDFLRHAQFFSTIGIILAVFLVRELAVRALNKRQDLVAESKRRWTSHIRNFSFLILAISLALVWFPQLETFALSLTAFALAIIIATKELILCLSGSVLRATTTAFSVGDMIEIDGLCGEVVEHNLMSTAIMEVNSQGGAEPYQMTGRRLVLPNSVLLSKHLVNYGLIRRYVFHRFDLFFDTGIDPQDLEQEIRAAAQEQTAALGDVAQRYHALVAARSGLDLPGTAPRVAPSTTSIGGICFTVTLFCPIKAAAEIQRQITAAALQAAHRQRGTAQAQAAPEPSPEA